ncbi:STAS domain-containing protein [Kitasatospora sp. NPDC004531]
MTRPVSVTVPVVGELDHESGDDLLAAVAAGLAGRPDAQVVRLDCHGMSHCDALGLSVLLQLRRDADAAGRRLFLDARPADLDRLLHLTGTAAYLLADHPEPPS